MSEIKILITQELKDFIDFIGEKGYVLKLDKKHSSITFDILQKYIDEYLERI
jgi:hypothetical protein